MHESKFLKLVAATIFLMTAALSCASEGPNFALLVGTYSGEVLNGTDLDPILTTFEIDNEGNFVGEHVLGEDDRLITGTLSDFNIEGQYTMSMTWSDIYGEGTLRILFSENYSSFMGFFGNEDTYVAAPWNGIKELD